MERQPDLIETFEAYDFAQLLNDEIDADETVDTEINAAYWFVTDNAPTTKEDSYTYLRVVGLGDLRQCYLWWFKDGSILLLARKEEDELVVGVLPPGTEFNPVPYSPDGIPSIH